MLFLYSLKRIDFKIFHLTSSQITTVGMLIIFLCLLISPKHLESLWNFLNGWHANMSFTNKNEMQNRMSFLDEQIIREDEKILRSVYHKPTFNEFYTHFNSFLPPSYKFGTAYTLAYRYFRIYSSCGLNDTLNYIL